MLKESQEFPGFPETAAPPVGVAERPTFAQMYREHAQAVARWAARLGGPTMEPEDLVQEVFLIAHRQLPTFRGDSRLSTWLFGITQNVVRHRRRKDRLRRMLAAVVGDPSQQEPPRPTPIDDLERREATRLLYKALEGMRDEYRTVFILFELEGLSGPEIVALTGANAATLRVRLFRARAQFTKRLALLEPARRGRV